MFYFKLKIHPFRSLQLTGRINQPNFEEQFLKNGKGKYSFHHYFLNKI